MSKKYKITVSGCDDSTEVEKTLTEKQFELIKTLAEDITKNANYNCKPSMSIEEII